MTIIDIRTALGTTFAEIAKTGVKKEDIIISNVNRFLAAAKSESDRDIKYQNFRTYIHALNTLHGKLIDDFDLDDAMYELFIVFVRA